MAANSKLLGDGRAHGLSGGTAFVVSATPRRGEHAFNHAGMCACGVARRYAGGKALYRTVAGWGLGVPVCALVRQ